MQGTAEETDNADASTCPRGPVKAQLQQILKMVIDDTGLRQIRDAALVQDGRRQRHIILKQLCDPGGQAGQCALVERQLGLGEKQQRIAGAEQDDPSLVEMFQRIFQRTLDQVYGWERFQILGIPVKGDLAEHKGIQILRRKSGYAVQGFQLIIFIGKKISPGGVAFLMVGPFLDGTEVFFIFLRLLIQFFLQLLKLRRQRLRADADLQYVVRGSQQQSGPDIFKIFIIADDEKFTGNVPLLYFADQLDSIHDRHLQIADHQVRLKPAGHIQRFLSVGSGGADMESQCVPVDHGPQSDLHNWFVINDQYLIHKCLLASFEFYCRNPARESVWSSRCHGRGGCRW